MRRFARSTMSATCHITLLIGLLLTLPTSVKAATYTVFGPKTYVRNPGRPLTVTDTITILNTNTQYALRVTNSRPAQDDDDDDDDDDDRGRRERHDHADENHARRVAKTLITINGVQVLAAHDFSNRVTVLSVPVNLLASNEIGVRVLGPKHGTITVRVVGVDTDLPTPGAPIATPPAVASDAETVVTVTSAIRDPTVISDSVKLLRLGPTGTSPRILSRLRDDGLGQDLLAGDGLFTARITLNERVEGYVALQVSAAFPEPLGTLQSTSTTVRITVAAALPPDPGQPGRATIAGIDSDGDGVRDDVQRYIALAHPNSARTRVALRQMATALQALLLNANDRDQTIGHIVELAYSLECSMSIHGISDAAALHRILLRQIANTSDRAQAYATANEQLATGFAYHLTPEPQWSSRCTFNPLSLPD